MKLSQESKDSIRRAYESDLIWLDTVKEEVTKTFQQMKSDLVYDYDDYNTILKLIDTLYSMNNVIIETEMEEYASKYNTQAQDLYSEMKIDLTKMIGYEITTPLFCHETYKVKPTFNRKLNRDFALMISDDDSLDGKYY